MEKCIRGHPLDEKNLYIPKKGNGRVCRECRKLSRKANPPYETKWEGLKDPLGKLGVRQGTAWDWLGK